MAKNKPTSTGRAYVATVTQPCEINGFDAEGAPKRIKTITDIAENNQYVFVAISDSTEITDDAAVIVPFIDAALAIDSGGEGGNIVVDQTYDATSAHAQSGAAMAGELANYFDSRKQNNAFKTNAGAITAPSALELSAYSSVTVRPSSGHGTVYIGRDSNVASVDITGGPNGEGVRIGAGEHSLVVKGTGATLDGYELMTSAALSAANTWSASQTIIVGGQSITFDAATIHALLYLLANMPADYQPLTA